MTATNLKRLMILEWVRRGYDPVRAAQKADEAIEKLQQQKQKTNNEN